MHSGARMAPSKENPLQDRNKRGKKKERKVKVWYMFDKVESRKYEPSVRVVSNILLAKGFF